MKKVFRILVCVSLVGLIYGTAFAAKYEWRLGSSTTPKYIEGQYFEYFVKKVDELSKGEIKITPYYGSQLGACKELFEQAAAGMLEFGTGSYSNIATLTSAFEVFQLPYLYDSLEQSFNAHFNPVIQEKVNERLRKIGLKWIMSVPLTPRQILSTNFKVAGPSDIKGKKFRCSRSKLEIAAVDAFGAKAVTIPWMEALDMMRTGAADGMTVPADMPYVTKIYDVIKYVGMANIMTVAHIGVVNIEWWNKQPQDAQDTIIQAIRETETWYKTALVDYINKGIASGKEKGVTYYGYDAETLAEWKRMGRSVWSDFSNICPPEDIKFIQENMGPAGDPNWGLKW